jgi:hypothetical protein
MSYLFQDLAGLALATLLAPILLCLPGLGLARLCARLGLDTGSYWERIGWAMILGLAILPVLDVLAIRAFHMPGMLWLNGTLALYGIAWLRGNRRGFTPIFLWLALLWWIICAWSYIDIDLAGRLHHSLIAFDMVKHAAVIEQIVRQGIPFSDPFFARDGFAGYYHYFYVWAAAIRWVGGDAVSALSAFGATSFWTGVTVVALIWRIAFEAKLIRPGRGRRVLILVTAFCFVAGADLLFMLLRYLIVGRIEPDIDSWNTEVRMLGTSVLWVPHHVAAVLAAWTGMLLSVRTHAQKGMERACLAMAAAAAFATMFGMSVWIALTIAPLLLVWTLIRLKARDRTLIIAGLAALLLSLPQVHDILTGRAPEDFPIAFGVRPFTVIFPADTPESQIWAMLLLPLSYALEFGLFALGARLYLRIRQPVDGDAAIVRRLIFWSACNALLVGSFLRSVLVNNDLGWRSVLFAVIAVLLWTLLPAQSIGSFRRIKPFALFLLILGASATIWDLAGLRVIRPPYFPMRTLEFTSAPELTHELRAAYGWAARNLPEGATLQHNANLTRRSLDFGLYGRHWPAVADREANLFGASRQAVDQRLAQLAPIFSGRALPQDLLNRSANARIDYLLFTAKDRVWRAQGGPPTGLACVYRSTLLCIARARDFRP